MDNNLVKIIKVKKGLFKNKILIEALGDCEVTYCMWVSSFTYRCRTYYIREDHKQWIKISKKCVFYENDIVNFSAVCNLLTYKQFKIYIEHN